MLTETAGTGDTPQGCLQQHHHPFAFREMILPKLILAACSASGWFRSAKDTAHGSPSGDTESRGKDLMDHPGSTFQQPRLGQACFPGLVLLQCRGSAASAELDALTWTGGEDSTPQGAPEGTGAGQN